MGESLKILASHGARPEQIPLLISEYQLLKGIVKRNLIFFPIYFRKTIWNTNNFAN